MKAITVDPNFPKNATPDHLRISCDIPIPEINEEEECLIRVGATAVNRADILQRQGKYPPPRGASPIMGLECAGHLVDPGTLEPLPGEPPVMALLSGGGYA